MVINLATGENVSLKSIPATWQYSSLLTVPYTYRFHPIHHCWCEAPVYILYSCNLLEAWSITHIIHYEQVKSFCIVTFHLLAYSDLNVLHKFKWSSNNATLACSSPCYGRMWFYHHSLGRCCSLLRYLPSLPNFDCLFIYNQIIQIRFFSPQMPYIFNSFK